MSKFLAFNEHNPDGPSYCRIFYTKASNMRSNRAFTRMKIRLVFFHFDFTTCTVMFCLVESA